MHTDSYISRLIDTHYVRRSLFALEKVECHGRKPSSCTCQMHNDGYIGYNARTFMGEREEKDSCSSSPRSFRNFLPRSKNAPKRVPAASSRSSLPVRLRRSWCSTREIRACPVIEGSADREERFRDRKLCNCARESEPYPSSRTHRGRRIAHATGIAAIRYTWKIARVPQESNMIVCVSRFRGCVLFFYLYDPHTYTVTALCLPNIRDTWQEILMRYRYLILIISLRSLSCVPLCRL